MTGRTVTAEERRAYDRATDRDQDRCLRCLRDCGKVERDHRQPRMPGNTVASNLQCLGAGCHRWKTENPRDAVLDGWAVLRHTTLAPSEWPARRWLPTIWGTVRLGWVLYRNEGDFIEIGDDEAAYRRRKAGVIQ